MKVVLAFIVMAQLQLLPACGDSSDANSPPDQGSFDLMQDDVTPGGSLREYELVRKLLATRLVKPGDHLHLRFYVDTISDSLNLQDLFKPSLVNLLAAYQGSPLQSKLSNFTPNGINTLIWFLIMKGLAADLVAECGEAENAFHLFDSSIFRPDVRAKIKDLCSWPNIEGSEVKLTALWDALLQDDAPDADKQLWMEFAMSSEIKERVGGEALQELIVGALFNPYILLQN